VTRNLYGEGVFNGTRATVTNMGFDAVTITTGEGRRVELHRTLIAQDVLDHGYAHTIHKAQGLTVERALLWADPGLYREAGYVGLSRAREVTHVYLAPTFEPADDLDCGVSRYEHNVCGASEAVLQLDRTHRHRLALEQLPRAHISRAV